MACVPAAKLQEQRRQQWGGAMRSGRDGAATPTWQNDGTSDLQGRRVLSWRQWDACGAGVYDRGVGEGTWRSGQHRLVLSLTPSDPLVMQIDGGPAQRVTPGVGLVSFYPAGPCHPHVRHGLPLRPRMLGPRAA